MVLGTHPTKPYLRRIWVAPFVVTVLYCTATVPHLRNAFQWDNDPMSLDDLQAQLRGALDQQFAALKQQYELSIDEARREAAMEAERDFQGKLELARAEFHQARTEWESQLQELIVAARADAEQCAAQSAAVQRQEYQQQLEAQFSQRLEHATAAAQRTAALEAESERRRAQHEIEAAVQRAKAEIDTERQRLQQERDVERQGLHQEIAAERQRLQQEREAVRGQAEQAAQQEREAARQQAQQEIAAERQRLQQEREAERGQAEQAAQQAREAARQQVQQEREAERQQLKQLLVAERQKLQQQLAAEGERARQELEALTARHQAEIAAAKQAAATAAAAAAKAAVPAPASASAALAGLPAGAFDRVLAAISDLDGTHTLAAALDLLLAHSGAVAGRAALFLIDGDRLKAWKASGIPDIDVNTVESAITGRDLLALAIQAGRATPASAEVPAPPFARQPAGRDALAVPVMIGGRAVAVLYADSGAKPSPAGSAAVIELLARHASTVVALRTAMRTLDVLRGVPADAPNGHADEQSARRFAKLLVSEIKLYNEAEVRAGRQQRDLRQRLRNEIARAQRLYEERVPPALSARSAYFQQELVQTLADGDATLLGSA
jgi:chemotaxis protein histidine kinase CheA